MSPNRKQELFKLHMVNSLFSTEHDGDLFFAQQIQDAVEISLPESDRSDLQLFLEKAKDLITQIDPDHSEKGIRVIDAHSNPETGFSFLDLRSRLIDSLKPLTKCESSLIVLTGLKDAICPKGKRWTAKRKSEYAEIVEYARQLCAKRSRPNSKLSLIII